MKRFKSILSNYYNNLLPSKLVSEDAAVKRIVFSVGILASICALGGFFVSLFYNLSPIYTYCAGFVSLIFLATIPISRFCSAFTTKLYFAITLPFWYNISTLLMGGGFAASSSWMTNLAFVYIFFRGHRYKWLMVIYTMLSFIMSLTYIDLFGPIVGYIDLPHDAAVTAMGSALGLTLIFEIYNTEKEELISDLKLKNQALERTTEELEQFTYIASHDLKTPLRNVSSFLDLIEHKVKKKDYETLEEDIAFAKKGSKQMYSLVTEILELTRVRNDLESNRTEVLFSKIADKVASELKEQYPRAIIKNKLSLAYYFNESHLYLVFQNLLLNALKYNDSFQPQVELWDDMNEASINIYIKDNGIGINKAYHKQIFEFFKRLHSNVKYEGTGLGLGLCKNIIDSYDGKISLESHVGQGSTFRIVLPVLKMKGESGILTSA